MEWLDDCLRLRRVLPAWPLAAVDDVLHRPKVTALGAPGAAELRLAQTNFRGEGRGIVQDLSEWLGIPHTKDLKKENTHLVCNVFTGQKYDRAKEWNVKAVNMLWLEDSIWEWELQPTDKYEQLDSKDAKAQAAHAEQTMLALKKALSGEHLKAPRRRRGETEAAEDGEWEQGDAREPDGEGETPAKAAAEETAAAQ